jgi:sirohydrochlorin cobaltochelatase
MAALADRVAAHLPGWRIRAATLAAPGALAGALAEIGGQPLVYPFFMTDGWFVSVNLPRRLAEAGAPDCRILRPFGLDPRIPRLMLDHAVAASHEAGLQAAATTLLVAAHGSPGDPRPKRATEAVAGVLRDSGRFAQVVTGYVDEAPGIEEAARGARSGLCLPFFVASNGHVRNDVPEALAAAGYTGRLLPPIGASSAVPAMIAAAFAAGIEASVPEPPLGFS